MTKNLKNLTRLEFLSPGDTFSIPSVPTMRNGVFLFTTETSSRCIVDVEDAGGWNNGRREYLANSVQVIITGHVELENSGGVWEIKGRTIADKRILKESRKTAEIDSDKIAKRENKQKEREERQKSLADIKLKKREKAAANKKNREEKISQKKVAKAASPGGTGQRGRKKKVLPPITFPDGEFSVIQIAEKHGLKNYDIANEMTRLKSLGKKIEVVRLQANPRGRPTSFYKIV